MRKLILAITAILTTTQLALSALSDTTTITEDRCTCTTQNVALPGDATWNCLCSCIATPAGPVSFDIAAPFGAGPQRTALIVAERKRQCGEEQ